MASHGYAVIIDYDHDNKTYTFGTVSTDFNWLTVKRNMSLEDIFGAWGTRMHSLQGAHVIVDSIGMDVPSKDRLRKFLDKQGWLKDSMLRWI